MTLSSSASVAASGGEATSGFPPELSHCDLAFLEGPVEVFELVVGQIQHAAAVAVSLSEQLHVFIQQGMLCLVVGSGLFAEKRSVIRYEGLVLPSQSWYCLPNADIVKGIRHSGILHSGILHSDIHIFRTASHA